MDLQIRRQGAYRWKGLTGLQRPVQHRARRREHDLLEDRFTGDEDQPEWCHIHNVTRVTRAGKTCTPTASTGLRARPAGWALRREVGGKGGTRTLDPGIMSAVL